MIKRHKKAPEIPPIGFLRIDQILRYIPIGKSTWWKWVADGKAPKPVKIGSMTTVWRASDILRFINDLDRGLYEDSQD